MIVWLNPNLEFSSAENQELIAQLRSIVDSIQTFTDLNQCMKFVEQMKIEQIFFIVSDCFVTQIPSLENQFPQLNCIYILCDKPSKYDQSIPSFKRGRGMFTQMKSLCSELKKDVRQLNSDSISISIVSVSADKNLNELEPSFMYFQLLKENLLTMKYKHEAEIQQLVDYFRPLYTDDCEETKNIAQVEHEYQNHEPIWWYTRESFLYKKLNYALRTFDVEILMKMGFFIQGLHKQIEQLHLEFYETENPFLVYRGLGMFIDDFEKLRKNAPGGLISFNTFTSTSRSRETAEGFASGNLDDATKKAVIFLMSIDKSISSVPFASVEKFSYYKNEDEILFSMSTVFRIGEVKQEKNLWEVKLTLTNDRDPLLRRLTEHMRRSLGSGNELRRIGQLMIKTSQFDKAMEIFEQLLKTVDSNDKAENAFLHNQLGWILKQKDRFKEGFEHYQEALRISQTYMSNTDVRLSSIYSNIGGILKKLDDASGALKYYELTLKIDLAAVKPNPLEIGIDHNNIGSALDDLGKYSDALKSYEEALNIKLAHLPPHHPSLASTYSNIGVIHRKMGDCSTALSFYEKTLQIQQKSLPSNHPALAVTLGKLATLMEKLHQYHDAIKHAKQAADIADKAYGSSHSETAKRQKYLNELQQKI